MLLKAVASAAITKSAGPTGRKELGKRARFGPFFRFALEVRQGSACRGPRREFPGLTPAGARAKAAPEQTTLHRTKKIIMRYTLSAIALLATLAAFPAAAQESPAPAEGQAPAVGGLSMGEPVAPGDAALGAPYVKAEHGEWDIRCIRTESGNDPCQLYQLLKDEQGNAVAEFTLFPLVPAQGEAVAGGNIISPLETLLPEGVTLAVDGSEARRFPFHFCTEVGCVARVGYAAADIENFKRGSEATVGIVPVVAAGQRISLKVSLSGFTAAYDAILAEAAAAAEAAGAAQGAGEGGN